MRQIKIILSNMLVLFLTLIVLFMGAEIYARITKPSLYQFDKKYGWKLKQNLNVVQQNTDLSGKDYVVKFLTNSDGIRTGNSQAETENSGSGSFKILVLGDSFTADPTASNDTMWFSVLAKELSKHFAIDTSVFAAGGGGWGTYQNVMLANELAQKYNTDLVILQFCENDFMNNLYDWESMGIVRNQYFNRPYAVFDDNNTMTSYRSSKLSAFLYRSFVNHSRVLRKLDALYQQYQYQKYGDYLPDIPKEELTDFQKRAVKVTAKLLDNFRKIFTAAPAFIVNCHETISDNYLSGKWKELGGNAGFEVLEKPARFIVSSKNNGKHQYINQDGGHLSELGNIEYGKIMAEEMISNQSVNAIFK